MARRRPRRPIGASVSDGEALHLKRGQERGIHWIPEQEALLKEWAEMCSSCAWMHTRAHRAYHHRNLSTLTGTANFAQSSMPAAWASYVPMVIGFVNILAGLISTLAQFLRLAELAEGHRIASISYAKLSRNMRTELALPSVERSVPGHEYIKSCRGEIDRLYEQSPEIPDSIVILFGRKIDKYPELAKPEMLQIRPARVWVPGEMERRMKIVAGLETRVTDNIAKRLELEMDRKARKAHARVPGSGVNLLPTPFGNTTSGSAQPTSESSSPRVVPQSRPAQSRPLPASISLPSAIPELSTDSDSGTGATSLRTRAPVTVTPQNQLHGLPPSSAATAASAPASIRGSPR